MGEVRAGSGLDEVPVRQQWFCDSNVPLLVGSVSIKR